MTLKDILKEMLQANASDLHLKVGTPPTIRVHGALRPIGTQTISGEHLRTFATQVLSERQQKALLEGRELDCALSVAGLGRFRCNVYYQRATPAFAIRRIPLDIRSIREWNLPPVVEELALRPRGLVLVTGITGQGKSTTIAAMIQHLNLNERRNIVTIEDPIEFLFRDHLSLISQREVGSDTRSFASALRHVLRQDPDVIMVGEIRDPETMDIVLKVADTGHLVFSTLHTPNAHQTIQRMLAFFPPHEHEEVRHRLAENVAGIVSMRLVPTVEGEGRVPACEVLVSTEAVREHIRDPVKVTRLPTLIEEGHVQYGMQSFDQALMKLYREGLVTYDEARRNATRPADFELQVRGVESASDTRWTQLTG